MLYRGAAAAAVREWREEEAPPAPQALPKRGDTWAKSRTDVQFMQEGHVYFPDSVRPGTPRKSHSFTAWVAMLLSISHARWECLPSNDPIELHALHVTDCVSVHFHENSTAIMVLSATTG